MTDEPMPVPPREPEIEFLGRVAHEGLRLLRVAFWIGGAAALAYGYEQFMAPYVDPATSSHSNPVLPAALGTIWFTLGLPLVLPTCWLLRKRWACISMAILYALMWFAPMGLPDESPYGFILRFFTTAVAFSSLLVWRTLWYLTNPNPRPAAQ
ncbi:MAG: hypothetical protein ACI91B_004540 [Planctomycetota bacterium]|jgi:hypothetical protein